MSIRRRKIAERLERPKNEQLWERILTKNTRMSRYLQRHAALNERRGECARARAVLIESCVTQGELE